MTATIRHALETDIPRLAAILSVAFADDPVITHLIPTGVSHRERRLQRFFTMAATRSQHNGSAWLTDDDAAAAIWHPAGAWRETWPAMIRGSGDYVRVFGRRLPRAARVQATLDSHHPTEPHWYLYLLATIPGTQSKGLGSALLRTVLSECDRSATSAYLEATSERNRALYLRHGFHDLDPLHLPSGGPTMYPMWRDPTP